MIWTARILHKNPTSSLKLLFEITDADIQYSIDMPESSTVGVMSHPFGKQTDVGNSCPKPCGKTRADPWVVYKLLGSYAFAAT